ncbi:MAG: DCC1-like thiol-disulfide oxidoreductase family protein [Actinomycetota bacterium]
MGTERADVERPERLVMLYDEDCGLCRWITDRVLDWDRRGRVRAAPIQGAEGDRLLAAIPPERRIGSMHAVRTDGTVTSAGRAVASVLHEVPLGEPFAWLADRAPSLTERLYRLAADHRTRLGGVVGAEACAVDPQRRRTPPPA